MSSLTELLKGQKVETKELGKLVKIEPGRISTKAATVDGEYKLFTTAATVYRTDTYGWNTEALMVVSRADVGAVKYYKGKFNVSQGTQVLTDFGNEVLPLYLYYVIKSKLKPYLEPRKNKSTVDFIAIDTLKSFPVPIPPIEVQEEIVRVLDKFTTLQTELTAELTGRRQQYEHYRDSIFETLSGNGGLLSRLEKTFGSFNVNIEDLAGIGTLIRGNGLQKKHLKSEGLPGIHYGQLYTQYNYKIFETLSYVAEKDTKGLRTAKPGDILLTGVSENKTDICTPKLWLGESEVYISSDMMAYRLKQNINSGYIANALRTTQFSKYKERWSQGAKVTRLPVSRLHAYTIPIPPKEVQEEIVRILDSFEAYLGSTTQGLQKEIELRKKQYEYYRDYIFNKLKQ